MYKLGGICTRREKGDAQIGIPIGRSDFDPALAVLECVVYRDAEAQLISVETEASLLIADVNDGKVQAEVGIASVEAKRGAVDAEREVVSSHRPELYAGCGIQAFDFEPRTLPIRFLGSENGSGGPQLKSRLALLGGADECVRPYTMLGILRLRGSGVCTWLAS